MDRRYFKPSREQERYTLVKMKVLESPYFTEITVDRFRSDDLMLGVSGVGVTKVCKTGGGKYRVKSVYVYDGFEVVEEVDGIDNCMSAIVRTQNDLSIYINVRIFVKSFSD